MTSFMTQAASRPGESPAPKRAPSDRLGRSSGQLRTQGRIALDPEDLEALIELARATNLAEAEKSAARARALLGGAAEVASDLIATLLERARQIERLLRLVSVDELTGVANRRAFNEALRRELSRARRAGSTLSVLLFDVDGLKAINDHLGHAGGDLALRSVAGCLNRSVRDGDFPARLGGDEFAVVLPSTGADEARSIGERIRAMVARTAPDGMKLGVSLGVSVTHGGDLDAAALLAAADAALYRDKAARRTQRIV